MSDFDFLIGSIQQSLDQAKQVLNGLYSRRNEFSKQPGTPLEEVERLEAEIATMENHVKQTGQVLSSLMVREQTCGFEVFGISAEKSNGDSL